ncbi:N-methyl-L-tryptophan oxidase [Algoriphagus sp. PAP.12]|uniref:N-methyl-L-tryptophan oxidase n=1 Tax=Algoriphagus sp. PAP.12 TaxID=2996678 RepID=UPI00227B2B2F|nr:N-methyl-L-tryptophan oxidase [Algoriphagus sp. PAP.12]
MKKVDIAVIGLGAVGSAALFFLSKSGKKVLGLDRFDPPHFMGSSHGETRITRLAVGEGKEYVSYAKRSQEIWKGLESETQNRLFNPCGGILMDSGITPWGKHGGDGFFEKTVGIAKSCSIPHSTWKSGELKEKYPQFQLEDSGKAYFEPSAGLVYPDRIIRIQLELAQQNGAEIKVYAPVKSIYAKQDSIILELKESQIEAKRVLISAGGWIKDFLAKEERPDYKICRQVLHWIEIEDGYSHYNESPVFMWGFGRKPEDFIYGFPTQDGKSVKMASESFLETTHPNNMDRSISKKEQEIFWNEKVEGRICGLKNQFLKSEVCLYTVRNDSKFVVKQLPTVPGAMMVSACSGHGFKHSAALGEELAGRILFSC